ncbi:ImmA/IrrE family metallo-endopeptidase [Fibrisoma montanum]|uniref:ImmA/IrrE family metallo-endopeptidase n=1 Tax=Fibrisoma montanum TaxID=2305895 RepID=A0A418M1B7_9BACT|nr:ImmA/IrrE family metallo-endopeptidase [Fibrisoma montanum]RIV19402.1 ImmA/IrrE family metallo-endopeptidase [Fibrisoma montanum]
MNFTNQDDIDAYLDRILQANTPSLQELFNQKLKELKIAKTTAYNLMGVHTTTMKGVLTGSQKQVDVRNLVKLANFLQLPLEQVAGLYIKSIEKNFPVNTITAKEVNFIKQNFDLAVLKKAGLIETISDFDHIKNRILARLGLRSIFEYKRPSIDVAFSSGAYKAESNLTRAFWISSALATLSEINNPNAYDREALVKLFPRISWYSTNIQNGLLEVSKLLFKLGVTVIYQPPLQALRINGATFNHNSKPAIVLSNHRGFYATLWIAFIHELYHVLFDWSEIKENKYHLTDDDNEQLSVQEREQEADAFAREYLLPNKKYELIRRYLNDYEYIKEFGLANHVEPSIIYVFSALDNQSTNRNAWARVNKFSPKLDQCKKPINWHWDDARTVEEAIPQYINEYSS